MPLVLILAVCACLASCAGDDSSAPSPDGPVLPNGTITNGPYLQSPSATAVTIMWETSGGSTGRLEYGPTPECAYSFDEPGPGVIHEIRLSDLATGTRYYYRVITEDESTHTDPPTGTFVTAPAPSSPFTFAAYGDSRADPVVHHAITEKVAAAAPAFFIHTGDFVSNGNSVSLWEEDFFTPAADLIRDVPFFPAFGNHEMDAQLCYDYFATPAAQAGSRTEAWYSSDYGCAHIVVLDTEYEVSPKGDQYAWFANDIASERSVNATWRIVVMHDPAYSSSLHGPNVMIQQYLVPLFETYRVSLVLNGHEHAYMRSFKDGVTYVGTGGGGAVLYPVNQTPNPYQLYAASAYHFVVFTVTSAQITGEARDIAGTGFDSFVIERPAGR